MNKKIIIFLMIFLVIIIYIAMSLFNKSDKNISDERKIKIGYEVLGNEYCEGHKLGGMAGDAITRWACKICGEEYENNNTATPKLCTNCANITNRCEECGRLK